MRPTLTVRIIKRPENKTAWGVYENNRLIDTFISKDRAEAYARAYRLVMR